MTGAELVDELGRRVEDESDDNFSVTHRNLLSFSTPS